MADRVAFVYSQWLLQYPVFAAVPQATVEALVPLAEQYWRNDGTSPATTEALQRQLLYLMVAHVVMLSVGTTGSNPSGLVGPVTTATEGSVSVGTNWPVTPASAWFLQTQYGALFWQLCAPFRTMHYRAGVRPVFSPFPRTY